MQISAKKTTLIVAVMALAAAGAFAALQRPIASSTAGIGLIEDADTVKADIAHAFAEGPGVFNLPASSNRLAKSRLDGFAVCTQSVEATAEQYVEVSQMLDKATKFVPELQRAVDGVMDSKAGMTDCDFRVITAISKVSAGG